LSDSFLKKPVENNVDLTFANKRAGSVPMGVNFANRLIKKGKNLFHQNVEVLR